MQRNRSVRFADIDSAAVIVEDDGELLLEIGAEQFGRGDRGAVEAGGVQIAIGQGALVAAIAGGAHLDLRIAGAHAPLGHDALGERCQVLADEAGVAVINLSEIIERLFGIGKGLRFKARGAENGHADPSSAGKGTAGASGGAAAQTTYQIQMTV